MHALLFLSPLPLTRHPTPHRHTNHHRPTPRMIQLPNEDGPPDLDAFFNLQRRAVGTTGGAITLATSRQTLSNHHMNATTATHAALTSASTTLQHPAQLIHITHAPDVNPDHVWHAVSQHKTSSVIGRTVQKKDAAGSIEVLLLSTEATGGITIGEARVEDTSLATTHVVHDVAKRATELALGQLQTDCTFVIFAHSGGVAEDVVRTGIDSARRGIVAYGGPAVSDASLGTGWALLVGGGVVREDAGCVVVVAAVPGSLSFLFSAVIKNWAQPNYVEAMEYLKPSYVGDPMLDLLTAIRFDDWDMFLQCIEEKGVDVNCKWVNKQNQTPLLAACARARTRIVAYLLANGADVDHRNDGGFTAVMYTRKLVEYDRAVILDQLDMLEKAGANITLTPEEVQKLKDSGSGDIVQ